jgi:hypothetical protein
MPQERVRAPAVAGQPGAPAANGWEDKLWSIGKNLAIFIAMQVAIRQFMGGGSTNNAPPGPVMATDGAQADNYQYASVPQGLHPLWPANTSVDIALYVSSSVIMPGFSAMPAESLIVRERNFSLASSEKDSREIHSSFQVPKSVQANGTLWAHIFVAQTGAVLDPSSASYDTSKAYRMLRPLTQYLAKKKVRKARNLLEAKNETETLVEEEIEEPTGPIVGSFYHPNFTLSFIPETGNVNYGQLHPAVKQYYVLESTGARDATGQNGWYYPVLYLNTFWQLKPHMVELNSTLPIDRLPININIGTLHNWAFSIMTSLDEGMKETARKAAHGQTTPGGGDGSEMDLIKETLLDTNVWLLGTTVVVSILHMIFEMLAFSSDVGHWRKKKDNVGVSVRTILSNVFMQGVIFLYLIDNNENTSWMILFGQGMGIAIEAWKVTQAVNVRLREPAPGSYAHKFGLPLTVVFEDKHKLSETEEKTEEYDRIAFKYMGIVAVPLLAAYAVYSLLYETHKSWYSFVITTLVGSVYAYGFLMMVSDRLVPHNCRFGFGS